MIYAPLGRTGIKVSAIGIGAGGPSRLGLAYGRSRESAVRLIRFGLDQGINVVDSAATYGTEDVVGTAIKDCRTKVILSTKAALGPYFGSLDGSRTASRLSARLGEVTSFVTSGRALEMRVHASLRRLKTDYIDIFHLHTVTPAQYARSLERALPALLRLRQSGKIRWIGITEAFPRDRVHQMLTRAAANGVFDCIMIGFNCLNQSGAQIAAAAKEHRSGIMAMYAVRGLRGQDSLQVLLDKLASWGLIEESQRDAARLVRLLNSHGVATLPEAAMRFCRYELNADVVLSGTGDTAHLYANIAACDAGPLPEAITAEFRRLFSKLDFLTGSERDSVLAPRTRSCQQAPAHPSRVKDARR
jgi:aryl-alcohol dehydrogenase-like predicted oxidoreductase